MAHFAAYNSTDPNLYNSTTKIGNKPVKKNEEIILGPIQTDRASYVAGSVFSDKKGEIFIEQSFDWDWNKEEGHWDISTKIAYAGAAGASFKEEIIAPTVRVRYKNGTEDQTEVRIFARAFDITN